MKKQNNKCKEKHKKEYQDELLDILLKIARDKKLLNDFLFDLLTPGELREIALRWQIIKQLKKGIPYREITDGLQVGIGTVTRGARMLLNEKGGFNQAIEHAQKG